MPDLSTPACPASQGVIRYAGLAGDLAKGGGSGVLFRGQGQGTAHIGYRRCVPSTGRMRRCLLCSGLRKGVPLRLRGKKGLVLHLLVFLALMLFMPSLLVAEDETDYADAIIVIGGDHKLARIQRAAELHRQGYAPIVIISAGTKVLEGNEWIPEAEVMHRQALALGLPEEALIIEDDSLSTIQNARYSKQICEDHNIKSILLVASAYHSGRARLVFREVMGAKISVSTQPAPRGHHPLLWWLYPDQAGVVLYEYKNWIQYWLGLRY